MRHHNGYRMKQSRCTCRLSALIQVAEQKYRVIILEITAIFIHNPLISGGVIVIGHINIIIHKNVHFNTLSRVLYRLFPSLWCFTRPLLQLSSAVVCGSLKSCVQQVKCMLHRIEIKWLTWPLQNIPLLCLKKTLSLLSHYVLYDWQYVSICTEKRSPVGTFFPQNCWFGHFLWSLW